MKLEQQVVSLKLAQKMKELGVKQESLFQHKLLEKEETYRITYGNPSTNTFGRKFIDSVSAFTVAELGELLKKQGNFISGYGLDSEKEYYCARVSLPEFAIWSENFVEADTEADARAKMLVYLIENK